MALRIMLNVQKKIAMKTMSGKQVTVETETVGESY